MDPRGRSRAKGGPGHGLGLSPGDKLPAPPPENEDDLGGGARDTAVNELFRKLAHSASEAAGTPWAFIVAASIILIWAMTGPLFHFSDTWQLVINTSTTILTFLMVFLIQNTQNRDAKAMQLKLDELIRSMQGARNALVNLEDLSDTELARLRQEFQRLGIAAESLDTKSPPA